MTSVSLSLASPSFVSSSSVVSSSIIVSSSSVAFSSGVRDQNSVFGPGRLPCRQGALVGFSRRMGFYRRPAICASDPQGRVFPSLSSPPSASSSSAVAVHGSVETGSDPRRRRGGGRSPLQGSRPSRLQGLERSRVAHLRRPEEGRRLEADHQPQVVEQDLSGSSSFPDGHSSGCGVSSSSGRLDGVHRPQGRILPHLRQPSFPPFSPLRLEGPALRVPCASVRSLPSPSHIHSGDKAAESVSERQRNPDRLLP